MTNGFVPATNMIRKDVAPISAVVPRSTSHPINAITNPIVTTGIPNPQMAKFLKCPKPMRCVSFS